MQKVFFLSIDRYIQIIGAKGLPFSELLAYLTFFTEFVAAVCLAIGLFTRIAAAMIAIEMIVIIFVFQWPNGYFWTNRGYEYALLWALLSIAIVFRGGGRFSARPAHRQGVLNWVELRKARRCRRLNAAPLAMKTKPRRSAAGFYIRQ